MSELAVVGTIDKVYDTVTGTSKTTGNEWKKVDFVVKTEDKYNNVFPFTMFGEEKVDNFLKYNKVGSKVEVKFNVSANLHNEKYYTNLSAWSVFTDKSEDAPQQEKVAEETDVTDLPF